MPACAHVCKHTYPWARTPNSPPSHPSSLGGSPFPSLDTQINKGVYSAPGLGQKRQSVKERKKRMVKDRLRRNEEEKGELQLFPSPGKFGPNATRLSPPAEPTSPLPTRLEREASIKNRSHRTWPGKFSRKRAKKEGVVWIDWITLSQKHQLWGWKWTDWQAAVSNDTD